MKKLGEGANKVDDNKLSHLRSLHWVNWTLVSLSLVGQIIQVILLKP